MQVLVVGYGKIGNIKASLWKSLGANVYVYDINPAAAQKAMDDGHLPYVEGLKTKDLIIDISSPAGQHYNSLEWALNNTSSSVHSILIEKPLASSAEELKKFTLLGASIKAKVLLNESYFSSAGLRALAAHTNGKLERIEIELSKNRLADTAKGRFFDYDLGAIGIEAPHMLAILQALRLRLDQITIAKSVLYVDAQQVENQGFEVHLDAGATSVVLKSFLGNFRSSGTRLIKANSTIRTIHVHTATHKYDLAFDPAPKLPRYHSRLISFTTPEDTLTVNEFADDHLKKHMEQLKNLDSVNPLLRLENAVNLSATLHRLRDSLEIVYISNQTAKSMPVTVTKKGLVQ